MKICTNPRLAAPGAPARRKGNGASNARTYATKTGDIPGIVIADGGVGSRLSSQHPRVRAFVYGERLPAAPTLPFGRWKAAS